MLLPVVVLQHRGDLAEGGRQHKGGAVETRREDTALTQPDVVQVDGVVGANAVSGAIIIIIVIIITIIIIIIIIIIVIIIVVIIVIIIVVVLEHELLRDLFDLVVGGEGGSEGSESPARHEVLQLSLAACVH